MFGMIRHTHQVSPQHTVVAYSDNASVMEGAHGRALRRPAGHRVWRYAKEERRCTTC